MKKQPSEINELTSVFAFHLKILSMANYKNCFKSAKHFVFSMSAWTMVTSVALFRLVSLWKYPGNVDVIVDVILTNATFTTLTKLCSLNTETFKEAMDILKGSNFTYFGQKHFCFLKKSMKRLQKEMFVITYALYVLVGLLMTATIYMKILWLMSFWYPINTNTTFGYSVAAIHQNVFLIFFGIILPLINTLISGLMSTTSIQFNILNKECEKLLDEDESLENNILNKCGIRIKQPSKVSCQKMFDKIKRTAEYYVEIINFSNRIQSTFKIGLLTQSLESSLCIFGCLFALLKSDSLFAERNLSCFTGVFYCVLQLLYFCYYGQLTYSNSDALSYSIYCNQWYEIDCKCSTDKTVRRLHNRRLRQSVLLLMVLCKRPTIFVAGISMELRLETFVTICQGAFSLVATFRNFN